MSKVIWQKAASLTGHPSPLQMHSSSLDTHLIHGSLDHISQLPKRHLDRFSCFAQLTLVINTRRYRKTDRQTDHATWTSVAVGRIYALRACEAA